MLSAPRSVSVSKGEIKLRFGDFDYDPLRHELRKGGIRVRIQKQPLAILLKLLESPGSLVTREDLRSQLWDSTTFVAFEHGLNSAMKRLRDALCDSADHPRYIETVPGEGYRFVALVESLPVPSPALTEANPAAISPIPPLESPPARRVLWPRGIGIAVSAALVVTAFAVWRHWSPPGKRGLNFEARDWVLITNFENRTGEPLLDGTLEYALGRELSNSQFVNVVPRERVDDVLRLMRKPLDTRIDAALGREICLRDGEVPALLTGRVEKLGSTYVLSASLVDPSRGVTAASLSEEDPAESQMAAAVRRLSNRIRGVLGEEHGLIQQSNDRLEKVTTPSLHALQLYTQADEASRMESRGTAVELLERALEEDPDFASAHLLLGYVYLARNEARGVPHFQRAFELADSVTDRERFFIRGAYYDVVAKDPQKAVEAYETLLRIYPDHFWGTNNLMRLYVGLGRTEDACKLWIRAANLSPADLDANATAAWTRAIVQQDVDGAGFYLGRASKLATEEGDHADPIVTTWLKLFPVYESWLQGNVQSAHAQLIQVEQASNDLDPEELGLSHLDFGEVREAERYFHFDPDADWSADAQGFLLFMKGDWRGLKKHLPKERNVSGPGSTASIFMARAGMWPEVEESIKDAGRGRRSTITEGELALARGHADEGIALLEEGLKSRLSWPGSAFFLGSESLARTYEKQGKLGEALRVLQQASAEKGRIYPNPMTGAGSFASVWMKTQIQLADLYRKMGRVQEAKKIEDELAKLLVYADSDHPILRALKERQHPQETAAGQ